MPAPIRKFLVLPPREKLFFAIAWTMLVGSRLLIWVAPFRAYARLFGEPMDGSLATSARNASIPPDVILVKRSVARATKAVPIRCVCLDQAMTAQLMLRWMRIPAILTLGLRGSGAGKPSAHAWVRYGNVLVVGGNQSARFTPLASFCAARTRISGAGERGLTDRSEADPA